METSKVVDELQRKMVRSVEEVIRTEISKSSSESQTIASTRHGMTTASVDSLLGDVDAAYPQFLPLCGIEWPDSIVAIRQRVQSRSVVGLFPSLNRAWVIVDNKLLLWNYATGRDFVCYDKCSEVIVSVSSVAPKKDVFHDYVNSIIVIATTKQVHIIGAAFSTKNVQESEMRLLDLSFSVKSPVVMSKVVCHEKSRRIFLGGLDGQLYELIYTKQATAYAPRMRLVNRSIYLGALPVLNSIGKLISSVQQTWINSAEAVKDCVVDQSRNRLFVLTETSTIQLWSLSDGECKLVTQCKHSMEALHATLYNNVPQSLSPIVGIFPTHTQEGAFALIGIAENGDKFHYFLTQHGWPRQEQSLVVKERSVAVDSDTVVTASFYSDGVCVTNNNSDYGESVHFVATPRVMHAPHNNVRDVVTTVYPPQGMDNGPIEAVSEATGPQAATIANELCAQVFSPPRQLLLLHRMGISIQIKLRPVDLLHTILATKDVARREEMLQRFRNGYSNTNFCTMLIQLAVGNTLRDGVQVDRSSANIGVMRRLSYASPSKALNAPDAEQLANMVLSPVSKTVATAALDILRHSSSPMVQETSHSSSQRTMEVTLSPCASSISTYLSRMLFPIWNEEVFSQSSSVAVGEDVLNFVDSSLCELSRLLHQLQDDIWVDNVYSRDVDINWQGHQVLLHLSGSHSDMVFSAHEATMLQASWIKTIATLVNNCTQVVAFIKHVKLVSLDVLKNALKDTALHRVSFSEVCLKKEVANKLARSICRHAVDAQKHMKAAQLDASVKLLNTMEKDCPFLFSSTDFVECKARASLEKFTRNTSSLSKAKLGELMGDVAPKAAALWTSGALSDICSMLVSLKFETEAVQLLMRAAAQVDMSQNSLDAYFTNQNQSNMGVFGVAQQGASEFAEKRKIVEAVIDILQTTWVNRKSAFDVILGTASSPGMIWSVEGNDQLTHFLLFDWLCETREDQTVASLLNSILVSSDSQFLEAYLQRNKEIFGVQLALFLRRKKKQFREATTTYVNVAKSHLRHIPSRARLDFRIRCLSEAIECATDGNDNVDHLEVMRSTFENQNHLLKIVTGYAQSRDPALDRLFEDRGMMRREGDAVEMDRRMLEENVVDEAQLFDMAQKYRNFGAAVIQLHILNSSQSQEESMYVDVLNGAFDVRHAPFEQVAKDILHRFNNPHTFPLGFVIKQLESHFYNLAPKGSTGAVDILVDAQLDLIMVIGTYRDLLENNNAFPPFDDYNRVSPAFMAHSFAHATRTLLHNSPQSPIAADSVTFAREFNDRVASHLQQRDATSIGPSASEESVALKRADDLVAQCEQILDGYHHDRYRH